jgi:phosphoribosylformylglycinamidine synthase
VSTRVGVVLFPGSNCEQDVIEAVRTLGSEAQILWHGDRTLDGVDVVVVPGGFAHGDYLRPGAIARFSPVMSSVVDFAAAGGAVVGICNGFQVLTEAHLLPGSMIKNDHLHFVCREQVLSVDNVDTAWTRDYTAGEHITIPLKNQDGQYVADEHTLDELEGEGRVVFRYQGWNPNGSRRGIAGISNAAGNVVGLMPHPEHAVEDLTGPGTDGLAFFTSVLSSLVGASK